MPRETQTATITDTTIPVMIDDALRPIEKVAFCKSLIILTLR